MNLREKIKKRVLNQPNKTKNKLVQPFQEAEQNLNKLDAFTFLFYLCHQYASQKMRVSCTARYVKIQLALQI